MPWSRFCLMLGTAFTLTFCILLAACSGTAGAASTRTGGGGQNSAGLGTPANATGGTPTPATTPAGQGQALKAPVIYVSGTSQNFNGAPAAGTLSGFIEALLVDVNSGVLTRIPGSPFSNNFSTGDDMALAPSGAFAYISAQQFPAGTCCVGTEFLLVFALDPVTGAPTLRQSLAVGGSAGAHVFVHPSNKFVYVSPFTDRASGSSGIGIFAVQSDGTLAFAGFTQAQSTGGAVLDPQGRFLFTNADDGPVNPAGGVCGPINSTMFVFRVDSTTGGLTPVAGGSAVFQRNVCQVGHAPQYLTLQVDPAGQRLFAVDSGNRTITVFAINQTSGVLALLPQMTTSNTTSTFTASALDPKGRFLYVGSLMDSFAGFSLAGAGTGVLPVLPGASVQVTPLPAFDEGSVSMAVDPSGTFLFSNENGFTSAFSCCGPDRFVGFRIDPATGALTQLSSTPLTLAGTASKIVVAAPQ
jgi:hypothetical protein